MGRCTACITELRKRRRGHRCPRKRHWQKHRIFCEQIRILICGMAAYVLIAGFGSQFQQVLTQYKTAIPLKAALGALGIGLLVGAFFFLGAIVLEFAMAWFFLRKAQGDSELPSWRGMAKYYYRDALM